VTFALLVQVSQLTDSHLFELDHHQRLDHFSMSFENRLQCRMVFRQIQFILNWDCFHRCSLDIRIGWVKCVKFNVKKL